MAAITITWNSITLKVLVGSEFNPYTPQTTISEIPLLPDTADLDAIASVIQQGPTLRNRFRGKCYVSAIGDYETLKGHLASGTTGTLVAGSFINATYTISYIGPARYVQSDYIDFDLELLEV